MNFSDRYPRLDGEGSLPEKPSASGRLGSVEETGGLYVPEWEFSVGELSDVEQAHRDVELEMREELAVAFRAEGPSLAEQNAQWDKDVPWKSADERAVIDDAMKSSEVDRIGDEPMVTWEVEIDTEDGVEIEEVEGSQSEYCGEQAYEHDEHGLGEYLDEGTVEKLRELDKALENKQKAVKRAIRKSQRLQGVKDHGDRGPDADPQLMAS